MGDTPWRVRRLCRGGRRRERSVPAVRAGRGGRSGGRRAGGHFVTCRLGGLFPFNLEHTHVRREARARAVQGRTQEGAGRAGSVGRAQQTVWRQAGGRSLCNLSPRRPWSF